MNGKTNVTTDSYEQSVARMQALGKEYSDSAQRLKARLSELKAIVHKLPTSERLKVERRIALLETEIRQTRLIGGEAAAFYLPGHRFLPRQSSAPYYGSYLC